MQFVYPNFLWALLAIAIPIVIHLFQFRRYKTIYFSNINFLKQVQQESTSQSKLKHLLVLIARVLTITALVFAFAQPFVPKRVEQLVNSKNFVSIYIDNSFSMGRVIDGFSLLEKAKQTAKQITNSYNENDRFQLITNDLSANQQRLISKEELQNVIEDVSLSSSSRRLDEIGKRQSEILSTEGGNVKTAYLISDYQQGNELNFKPDTSIKFNLIPLVSPSTQNVYIDSCWFFEPIQLVGQSNSLIIKIRNSRGDDITDGRLTMKLNGQQKAIADFTVTAGGVILDTITFSNEKPGWNNAELFIQDNEVTFDDTYYLAFKVLEKVNVLSITDGQPNKFIAAVFANQPLFNYEYQAQNNLNFERLKQQEFIIISNQSELSSGLISALTTYVADGGTVALFPEFGSDLKSYNNLLSNFSASNIELFKEELSKIDKPVLEQNIFKDVFEKTPENMRLPSLKKYAVFSKVFSPSKEVILQSEKGEPVVMRFSFKLGSVYLSAVAANEQNSELPINALFAPMLFKMAVMNVGNSKSLHTIGYRTIMPINVIAPKENVFRVSNATMEFIPRQFVSGNQTVLTLDAEIRDAGFYNVVNRDNDSTVSIIAANYNRAESVMSFLDEQDLKKALGGFSNINFIGSSGENIGAAIQSLDKATLLWKYFLIAALLFILIEILLLRFWKR